MGGTGDVGRRVVPLLLDHTDCPITLASRQGGADADRVRQIQLDVRAPEAAGQITPGATVINLTEATPPAVAAEIVRKGGVFLDTSADPDYVAALDEAMAAAGGPGTGVLCVGTAPGLSTLMAAHVARSGAVMSVEFGIELGMGRHYGPAATEWFFRAIGKTYQVNDPHGQHSQLPGTERRRFAFADRERSRLALGIGFPHRGIQSAGKVLAVHSYLAVSPTLVTHAVAFLLRLGLGAALARRARSLTRLMLALPALGRRTRDSWPFRPHRMEKKSPAAGLPVVTRQI